MRTAAIATLGLLIGAVAFVLAPTAVGDAHATATAGTPLTHATVMGHGNGCGYEHGPGGQNGNDGNHDDNNGGGNDEDGDHDCTEQTPD